MKKLLFVFIGLFPLLSFSQNLHVDLFGGIATYQGDLQNKRFSLEQSKPSVGLGLSYDLSSKFSIRSGFTYGVVEGDDKKNTSAKGNDARNLNFKTAISELHVGLEYNFFNIEGTSLTPYVFVGLAVFHFNPYTKDTAGNKVYLHPLSTEGEGLAAYPDRKEYKLTQLSIPFGGGLKFKLSESLCVGLELGIRKLFTDYLDDVSTTYAPDAFPVDATTGLPTPGFLLQDRSYELGTTIGNKGRQRGNSTQNDSYVTFHVGLSFNLQSYRCPTPGTRR